MIKGTVELLLWSSTPKIRTQESDVAGMRAETGTKLSGFILFVCLYGHFGVEDHVNTTSFHNPFEHAAGQYWV